MELAEFTTELYPHVHLLKRLARRWAGPEGDDLVQETFARAIAARHSYQAGSNGRAWLCRILCNLAVSERRRRARDERLRTRVIALAPPPVQSEPAPRALDDAELVAALAELPACDRRILELAEIEELSYREIARVLACPLGTVMSRLHRARRRLRQAAQVCRQARTETLRAAA